MPYTLRHYSSFADRITVYDGMSTDRTRDICKEFGVELVDFVTDGLNDMKNLEVKNTGWIANRGSDWVICADTDELLYFPQGVEKTLDSYDDQDLGIIKTQGYEMFSETFPTTSGQIYEELYMGSKEDRWYSKPILFSRKRMLSMNFSAGAHTARGMRKDGRVIDQPKTPCNPPTYLLHYHQIGPLDFIAARYDATRKRLSAENVRNGHGNFDPGMKHALDKRALILPGLHRVL